MNSEHISVSLPLLHNTVKLLCDDRSTFSENICEVTPTTYAMFSYMREIIPNLAYTQPHDTKNEKTNNSVSTNMQTKVISVFLRGTVQRDGSGPDKAHSIGRH